MLRKLFSCPFLGGIDLSLHLAQGRRKLLQHARFILFYLHCCKNDCFSVNVSVYPVDPRTSTINALTLASMTNSKVALKDKTANLLVVLVA